ncbi:MAG: helix-turn-helix domain-containing protein [Aliidongia sp.]
MATASDRNDSEAKRPVGRPARIDLRAIVDVALQIGLDRVTMKAVAERLDVGIATLYQHVRSRDDLIRMGALRLSLTRRTPEDSNQHWAELATQYASSLYEMLVAEPQLIAELMKGGYGPDTEIDFLEQFLVAMQSRGFSPRDGVRLYRGLSILAMGAAVAEAHFQAIRRAGTNLSTAVRRALAEREETELPLLRSVLDAYIDFDSAQWLGSIRELLASTAAARGETLPES